MYICIETISVWEVDEPVEPGRLFATLGMICEPTDLVVVGSYNPSKDARAWLLEHEVEVPLKGRPFHDSFDTNRKEYPLGKAYVMPATSEVLEGLARLCEMMQGSVDKALFFDHVLAYRPGKPTLPLMVFHDAFFGGEMFLSGHYSEAEVKAFADGMGCAMKQRDNPEVTALMPEDVVWAWTQARGG